MSDPDKAGCFGGCIGAIIGVVVAAAAAVHIFHFTSSLIATPLMFGGLCVGMLIGGILAKHFAKTQ